MKHIPLALPDVVLFEPRVFGDDRGFFFESFNQAQFEAAIGRSVTFVQDNHSRSTTKGVLRGLHYQREPMAQGKLVRCIVGAVYDVVVDIRRASPMYGRWEATELTAENRHMLWVPPGFAHGVCTLEPATELLYRTTAEYSPTHDRGIRWNDPAIAIAWPTLDPLLSAKDAAAPLLADADNDFEWKPQ